MRASDRSLAKPWMRSLTRPFRINAGVAIALGAIAAGCAALLMFVSGYLISRTAQPATTLFMVMVPVALVQLFGIVKPVARYFERLISHDWVFRVTSRLRVLLFQSIESRYDDPTASRGSGEYLEMVSDDIGHLQNLYLRVAFPTIIALLLFVVASLLCGVFSFSVAAAFFIYAAITTLVIPLVAYRLAKPLQARSSALVSAEYASLLDDIMGASDWALAKRAFEAREAHERALEAAAKSAAQIRRLVRVAELVSSLLLACGVCSIVITSAESFQTFDTANLIAAFALGVFPIAETFAMLPGAFVDVHRHTDALQRLDDVINEDSALHEPSSAPSSSPRQQDEGAAICFSDVSYTYPEATRPALSHLSLIIPAGQKVAVLGASGSGKTTLARLIRKSLTPSSGTAVVGGQDGGMSASCALVGLIPQSPHIFDQTLRENLALAKPDATDDEMIDSLFSVGLGPKFSTLEQGLDTHVGETGVGFSGGEAHRIALARALLANCPIMLLDEPFAALDPTTEAALISTLFDAFCDKTLVVVTHHLTGIERFDRVVFVEDGRIALDGSPKDLMLESEWFVRLLRLDRFEL